MTNIRPATHFAASGAAIFAICAAFPQLAFAQAAESQASNSPVAESHMEHAGMHAVPNVDLSGAAEIGEAASVVTTDSTAVVTVSNFAFSPSTVTIAQASAVRWEFPDSTTHTATDTTAMGLFDSGNKSMGAAYTASFTSAGTYPYHCQIHSSMQGTVQVPIQVAPASGTATTAYKIVWSSVPAEAGFVFDIQIKRPGARSFVNWKMGRTKRMSAFSPAGPGKYSFRARLRKASNGAHSLYSPLRTITVQ